MDGRERLRALCADRELLLHRVMAIDADVATICDDSRLAVEAEGLWRCRGSAGRLRATAFGEIAREVAADIAAILDERRADLPHGSSQEQTKE